MSVNSGTGGAASTNDLRQNFTNAGNPAAASAPDVNQAGANNNGSQGMWSFMDGGIATPISNQSGAALVQGLVRGMQEILDQDKNPQFNTKIVAIDNTADTRWRYSTVIVALQNKTEGNVVAYYPLLLETTAARPLESVLREVGNATYALQQVSSDALDTAQADEIRLQVGKVFPGMSLLDANGMVVPADFNLSDDPKNTNIRKLLYWAVRACAHVIVEQNPSFTDFNLARRTDNSTQVVSLVVPQNSDVLDVVDEPVRQDFLFTLTARSKDYNPQQQQSRATLNDVGQAETRVGQIGGFIDIAYVPNVPSTMPMMYGAPVDPLSRTRLFSSRAIITNIDQPKIATLSSTLMMIFLTTSLAEPSNVLGVLYQRMKNHRAAVGQKDKGVDPTDLGMLNLASNITGAKHNGVDQGVPVDLKGNDVTETKVQEYLMQVFQPSVSLAIDVPRAGPSSWVLNVFNGAANGNKNALDEIVKAANKLTNGAFARYFNTQGLPLTNSMIFAETNNTVHLGYFYAASPDGGQVKRDIRTIDYLYVLNRYGTLDKTPYDWATSFLVDRINPIQRMARRKEIIEATAAGKVVFTGFAERQTFAAPFIGALTAACVEAGLKPGFQFSNPLAGANQGLGAPAFLETGTLNANLASLSFNPVGQTAAQGGALQNITSGRWV